MEYNINRRARSARITIFKKLLMTALVKETSVDIEMMSSRVSEAYSLYGMASPVVPDDSPL